MQACAQPSGRFQALASKHSNASRAVFQGRVCSRAPARVFQVNAAISRSKKEEIVAEITQRLSDCSLVYGLRYKGVSVGRLESLRRDLPPGATMYIAKNRLLRVAVDNLGEDSAKWEGLRGQKGDNAWVFANEDAIRGSVKAFTKFAKVLKDNQFVAKNEAAPPPPTAVTTIVLDGNVLQASQMASLERLPTKLEVITQIARGIKANPTKIATGIQGVSRKLAYGVKALSELSEDTSMTVAAAAEAKAASA